MTFAVVSVQDSKEIVVGTIWAQAEDQAHLLASNVVQNHGTGGSFVLRRAENREIPMKWANTGPTFPFHS